MIKRILYYTILFIAAVIVYAAKDVPQTYAACPLSTDVGYSDDATDTTYAWSKSGVGGINVQGGTQTCRCKKAFSNGVLVCQNEGPLAQCVTRPDAQGKCWPGNGAPGVYADGCTKIAGRGEVACATAMPLNIRIQLSNGTGVAGKHVEVYFGQGFGGNPGGWYTTRTTDSSGNISITGLLYTGMHFHINPWSGEGYTYSPYMYGENIWAPGTNWGALEMNTHWSCGTSPFKNGANNPSPVCVFTATPAPTNTPTPTKTPTPTPSPTPAPIYSISGRIYNDLNGNGVYNSGVDQIYTGSQQVTVTGPTNRTVTPSNGVYTASNLLPGNYTVRYTPPTGYTVSYIQNGPPPTFNVSIGSGGGYSCNTNSYTSATCGSGNISNLNFGISNVQSWFQSVCGSIRNDNGLNNPIPAAASCTAPDGPYAITTNSTCSAPGVVYGGDSYNLNGQQASTANYIVGGATYPDEYTTSGTGIIRTSYDYMNTSSKQAGLTMTNLQTICTGGVLNKKTGGPGCSIVANPASGIYYANDDVDLNAYTFPSNKNYVFLINGKLEVFGKLALSSGSTFTASVKDNITIDKNLGTTGTSTVSSLEGFYSTDKSFIVETSGTCPDLRLNIVGAVVVNASKTDGTFQNNRTLCAQNATCPVLSITYRPDLLVKTPTFVKHSPVVWKESAP